MSRFDYPDPGTDPAYCNALAADDEDEPMTVVAGMVVRSSLNGRAFTVEQVGKEELRMDGVWYRISLIRRWINTGVLTIVVSEEQNDAKDQ